MVSAFVSGVGPAAGRKMRSQVRMCQPDEKKAKPRLRKEIFDGFKTQNYDGFEGKGMGSKFATDMRPNHMRSSDVCDDCEGKGEKVCAVCNGRPEFMDVVTGEKHICEACNGETVTCSTCFGTGVRPRMEGNWWDDLLKQIPQFAGTRK